MQAPHPKRIEHIHSEHGVQRVDPYHWMKDREDVDIIPHLESENQYVEHNLGGFDRRDALYDEMLARIQETDSSVPYPKGPFRYYQRTEEGKAYPIYCRTPRDGGPEEVVLDHNALAEGHAYYQISSLKISPDHQKLAWLEDTSGAEQFALRVKDLTSQDLLDYRCEGLKWSLAWANDNQTLFVTQSDHASRPGAILRVGPGPTPATKVLAEPDETFFMSAHRSRDGKLILLSCESKTTSEWHTVSADDPTSTPNMVIPRTPGHEYQVSHHHGRLLLRTNAGGSNFEIRSRAIDGTDERVEVPHSESVMIWALVAFDQHWVIGEREQGLPRLRVHDCQTADNHLVAVPEPVYDIDFAANAEFDTHELRFTYTSLITPFSTFAYDMNTRESVLLKEEPVLGGYDRTQFETQRVFAAGKDGVEIPISIVRKKGVCKPGPFLLYGYGAYGHSIDVYFTSQRLSLIERGVTFAIAHIRGGSELGRQWYDQGKLGHKQNTFDDFIACANHLVDSGWTTPQQTAVMGGSAGGLLIGAVLNQRPDIAGAAVAMVPFVDALNTMMDDKLPLTVTEYEEWGDPNQRESYDRIRSYAPYENIHEASYPAVLATSGLNDPRVGYWEATKWIAKLRDHQQGDKPVLLNTIMDAGHAGATDRYAHLREVALVYAFLLQQWNL